jgi:hypothetical protein
MKPEISPTRAPRFALPFFNFISFVLRGYSPLILGFVFFNIVETQNATFYLIFCFVGLLSFASYVFWDSISGFRINLFPRSSKPVMPSFPRSWSLFAFLLPREVRERVYEPAHQELLEDYTLARRSYRTKQARRWLTFCFTVRTAMMWAESLRVMACSKGAKALRWLAYVVFGSQSIKSVRVILFELFGRHF